jgi:hypothetical protein
VVTTQGRRRKEISEGEVQCVKRGHWALTIEIVVSADHQRMTLGPNRLRVCCTVARVVGELQPVVRPATESHQLIRLQPNQSISQLVHPARGPRVLVGHARQRRNSVTRGREPLIKRAKRQERAKEQQEQEPP